MTGFEFGYCTDQPSIDIEVDFYHQLSYCNLTSQPFVTVPLMALPGSGSGAAESFTVVVDLRGGSGALAPFTLLGCGDGQWQGPTLTNERFAWGIRILNLVGTSTGPLTAGDVGAPDGVWAAGTRWSRPSVDYSTSANGQGSQGTFRYMPGNICFDMYPWATALYLRLFADACGTLVGEPFCAGDGGATTCPCGNSSPPLNLEGCRSSVNGVNGGRLEVLGTASLSADSVLLRALRLPSATSALFFQGTQRQSAGSGALLGDGLRCAGGSITRLTSKSATAGQVEFPLAGDPAISALGGITAPGTRTYQLWYRNSANFCTPSTFNLTNGWELAWAP